MKTGVAVVGAALFFAMSVRADEGKFSVQEVSFKATFDKSKIESGVAYDTDGDAFDGQRYGLKVTLPAQEVPSGSQAEIDEITGTWVIGPSFTVESSVGRPDAANAGEWLLSVEPQWSFQRFTYYPDLTSAEKDVRHSLVGQVNTFYHWNRNALQLRLRYAREWKAADELGIVSDGEGDAPALVERKVVRDEPRTTPAAVARLSFWHRFPESALALGPALAVNANGPKGDGWNASATGGQSLLRLELWLYAMPASASTVNLRFGFSPFLDAYLKGESPDKNTTELGLLFQARVGAELFTY